MSAPVLAGLVVHWQARDALRALLRSWPAGEARCELVVVDNGGGHGLEAEMAASGARFAGAGSNLGFAGGLNRGLGATAAPWVLVLNPDLRLDPETLPSLLDAILQQPGAAGFVPRLVDEDGSDQCRWQLRPLPTLRDLLSQAAFLDRPRGPRLPPAPGTVIEQPAAAALLLRRSALAAIGGFDERFYPAWFEDVDLARRLRARGEALLYWPAARLVHARASSLPALGYDRFLWLYARNAQRYVHKHHGRPAAALHRAVVVAASLLRLSLLPVRRPRRARDRREAARGLLQLWLGAATGYRVPATLRRTSEPPPRSRPRR